MSEVWVIVLEVLLLAGLVALAIRKKKNCTQQYDEMQLRVRGTGYKIGFLTALVMMGLVALLAECGLLGVVTPGLAAMAALMISVTVFAVYCILHDAFVAFRGNPKNHFLIFGMVILVETVNIIRTAIRGEFLVNGVIDFSAGAAVLTGAAFLAIFITLVVKTLRERKEAEE